MREEDGYKVYKIVEWIKLFHETVQLVCVPQMAEFHEQTHDC